MRFQREGGHGMHRLWMARRDRALLLLVLAFALIAQLLFATIRDDAFITFRYADNIAAGHGAVFNLGERVEGPADFLWLVLVTLPKALFGLDVATVALVLSTTCVLGCVVLAYQLGGRFGLLAAVLTAGFSGLAAYGLAGTEMPLFVLLVLAVAHAVKTRHPMVAGVLAALAMMTRPEGIALVGLAGLWLAVRAARRLVSWWAPVGFVLGMLVFAAPWLVWRSTYYDQAVTTRPVVPFSVASYGFLLATLAAVGVAVVCEVRARPSPTPRRGPLAVATVALAVCALSLPISAAASHGVSDRRAQLAETTEIGSWLADHLPPGSVIGTGGSLALAYAVGSRLVVTDKVRGRPVLIGYATTKDCTQSGGYLAATFRRAETGAWVTVYPRDDQFRQLVQLLDDDPRLTYVPCP